VLSLMSLDHFNVYLNTRRLFCAVLGLCNLSCVNVSVWKYGLALLIGPNWIGSTIRWRQNPVSETYVLIKTGWWIMSRNTVIRFNCWVLHPVARVSTNAFLKTTVHNNVSVLDFIVHYLLHVSAPIGGHLQVKCTHYRNQILVGLIN
jgi:hypothetical protein